MFLFMIIVIILQLIVIHLKKFPNFTQVLFQSKNCYYFFSIWNFVYYLGLFEKYNFIIHQIWCSSLFYNNVCKTFTYIRFINLFQLFTFQILVKLNKSICFISLIDSKLRALINFYYSSTSSQMILSFFAKSLSLPVLRYKIFTSNIFKL